MFNSSLLTNKGETSRVSKVDGRKIDTKVAIFYRLVHEYLKLAITLMILFYLGLLFLFTFFRVLICNTFTLVSTALKNYKVSKSYMY